MPDPTPPSSKVKSALVLLLGALAGFYLVNPTAGIFEFIPDNIPLVGNLDEAAATALLISAFAYFGINVVPFLGAYNKTNSKDRPPTP